MNEFIPSIYILYWCLPMALNMTYACLYIRFFICLEVSARATHIIMFVVGHNLPWMEYIEAFRSRWHQ